MSNVIAIDGPAASGKSTAARLLAERLNIAYVNTGSLYRAVALAARRAGQEMGALSPEFLNTLKLEYVPDQNGRYELKLDGSFPGRRTAQRGDRFGGEPGRDAAGGARLPARRAAFLRRGEADCDGGTGYRNGDLSGRPLQVFHHRDAGRSGRGGVWRSPAR